MQHKEWWVWLAAAGGPPGWHLCSSSQVGCWCQHCGCGVLCCAADPFCAAAQRL